MSMVGAHRNGDFAALLQFEEGFHYVIHVDVAFQVVGFVEVAFGVALILQGAKPVRLAAGALLFYEEK